MTPEKSAEIQQAMQAADATVAGEAVAKFGPVAGDVCAALADLMNQMKFFVQIIEGDMTGYALQHAEMVARVKHGVCELAKIDQNEFGAMMFKLAGTRFYVHDDDRKPNA